MSFVFRNAKNGSFGMRLKIFYGINFSPGIIAECSTNPSIIMKRITCANIYVYFQPVTSNLCGLWDVIFETFENTLEFIVCVRKTNIIRVNRSKRNIREIAFWEICKYVDYFRWSISLLRTQMQELYIGSFFNITL